MTKPSTIAGLPSSSNQCDWFCLQQQLKLIYSSSHSQSLALLCSSPILFTADPAAVLSTHCMWSVATWTALFYADTTRVERDTVWLLRVVLAMPYICRLYAVFGAAGCEHEDADIPRLPGQQSVGTCGACACILGTAPTRFV